VSGSSIEWTDETWNPVRGCSRVSEGCRNCYAERFAARGLPGHRSPTTGEPFARMTESGPRWTGKVELIPSKLEEPLRREKPRRIFVNSMSDLFHEALPFQAIAAVFGIMAACPQHTFQVLTKRPRRILEFCAWLSTDGRRYIELGETQPAATLAWWLLGFTGMRHPWSEGYREPTIRAPWPLPNVWLGVSVEDRATAAARIPILLRCDAARRFVSYEPALGPVDFSPYLRPEFSWCGAELASDATRAAIAAVAKAAAKMTGAAYLDWLIVGGESGPGARPLNVQWAGSAAAQCKAAGVACFIKQDSGPRPGLQGRIPDELWSLKEFPA